MIGIANCTVENRLNKETFWNRSGDLKGKFSFLTFL